MAAYLPYIRIFGADQVQGMLHRGELALKDARAINRKIADDMMRVIKMTFMGQGRRYGGSWYALDIATVREKRRKGLDHRILIARGRLMDSYTKPRSRNQILRIDRDSIELGSRLGYAAIHQFGDEAKGIPARPFIDFDPRDHARWARIVETELMQRMGFTS